MDTFDVLTNDADTDDAFEDDDRPEDDTGGVAARPGLAPASSGGDAAARGWGPGWPHPRTDRIVTAVCGGNAVRLPVRAEIAPLVRRLVAELEEHHPAFRAGWCWGFANRAIRGSTRPSNHSWGLAIDLDAPANPMTTDPAAHHTIGSYATGIAARYGFRWGGDYRGRKDFMHFEFLGTPADAAALAGGSGAPMAYPGRVLRRGDPSGPAVWAVQDELAEAGVYTAGRGPFGPRTEAAVRAFQTAHGLDSDGVVGPLTWAALRPALPE
jgi:D-alanyl-D-alanine carboxypeptidase/Putative peptidoglycan binding domain